MYDKMRVGYVILSRCLIIKSSNGVFYMQKTLDNYKTIVQANSQSSPFISRTLIRRIAPLITFIVVVALWQLVVTLELVDDFMIPAPIDVFEKFGAVIDSGILWTHTRATLHATLVGLLIGGGIGVLLGYLIARIPILEDVLSPLIVAFQSTPVVAYAPLLVIWFGAGTQSKIVTSALIVFFPILMNTVVGIRNVPTGLHDLMRVSGASRWQTFIKLEIPAALPILLTGLKTGATLAIIGAVVGEFIAARAGLGLLINLAKTQYDTPLVFVGVITLAFIASTIYALISLLERRLLSWQARR